MKKNKLFILLLLIISNKLYSEVTAEAGFDKADITIGEKVRYTVTIEAPKDTKIEFPVIDSTLTGTGFAIRDFGEEKPVKITRDRIRIRHWYLLDTYAAGSYNVPAVTMAYILPGGSSGSASTKDVFLEVKGVIKEGEKTEDIRDIKGPVEIPYSYKKIIIWGLVTVVILLAAAIGLRYRHKVIPALPQVPPHVIALSELEKIKGEVDLRKYYTGVSGIVRHYIEDRFNLHAPEMTTEEFLTELAGTGTLNQAHKALLRDFLSHCDLVKFARYGPTQDEIGMVYNTAKIFIEETKPL